MGSKNGKKTAGTKAKAKRKRKRKPKPKATPKPKTKPRASVAAALKTAADDLARLEAEMEEFEKEEEETPKGEELKKFKKPKRPAKMTQFEIMAFRAVKANTLRKELDLKKETRDRLADIREVDKADNQALLDSFVLSRGLSEADLQHYLLDLDTGEWLDQEKK